MRMPDFQKLLDQFASAYKFTELVKRHELSSDTFGYEIKTNKGKMLVFEVDFISNFQSVKDDIATIGAYSEFVPVKEQLVFEKSGPFLASLKYPRPMNWDEIKKFANDKHGSEKFYFTFLLAR